MPRFYFDKESHSYWLDEVQIPSLSEIIRPLDDYSFVRPAVLANKAEFGTNVHETIRLHLDGNLDYDNLSEGNLRAVNLFETFRLDPLIPSKILEWEKPTYNEKLEYGTTPDLVCEEAIIEIKTRPMKLFRDAVQLVAQGKCFPDFPVKSYWVLYLDIKKNKYDLKKCEHPYAWSTFRKLLDRYNREKDFSEFLIKWKEQCK